jgi:hypothetical protein
VTRWGLLLLASYLALGLSPAAAPRAVRIAAVLTALVMFAVMVKSGPAG